MTFPTRLAANPLADPRLPRILSSAAAGFEPFLSSFRTDPDPIFGSVGMDPEIINRPFGEITLAQFCRLFELAAHNTQFDNFGLLFGNGYGPKQLGPLGYAVAHAPTLSAGIGLLCRYFAAHQQLTIIRLRTEEDFGFLEYRIFDARVGPCRQDAELSLAIFRNIFRYALGARWAPLEVHFEHPRPAEPKDHERIFEAPVFFGQPMNALMFRRDDLKAAMPTPDPYLVDMLTPILEERATRIQRPQIAPMVQRAIEARLASGNVEMDAVAKDLSLEAPEIKRSLKQEGTLYRDLVASTRRDLALRYLRQRHLSLTEIAPMLGYSELSAFSRAFQAWSGVSPSDYRASMQDTH